VTLDIDDYPSNEEIRAVRKYGREYVRRYKVLSIRSLLTLAVFTGATSLFLAGMPLHAWWNAVGRFLLLATAIPFAWAIYAVAMWWGSFAQSRDFEKTYSPEEK
jgi:hypothetical protein